jgi:DNA-directed RNA polymerase specialized sigma24 family protein
MIDRMDRPADGFEAFYRDTWRDAVRWAAALTGDRAAAEDVAQTAFAAVGDRFGGIDDPTAYLRRCVVNLARSRAAHRVPLSPAARLTQIGVSHGVSV